MFEKLKLFFIILLTFIPELLMAQVAEEMALIRQQLMLRKGRHEIMPSIGLSLNDPYIRHLFIGFSYNYHFTNWFSAGADFNYATFFSTDLKRRIEDEKHEEGSSFFVEASYIKMLTGINLQMTPIIGKLMIFGKYMVHWDIHFTGGGSLAMLEGQGSIQNLKGFAPFFGSGVRLFIIKWLGLNIEARDYLIQRMVVKSENVEKTFGHNFIMTFGVSILLPLEVEKSL